MAEWKDHNGGWCRACWVDDMLDEVDCFPPADATAALKWPEALERLADYEDSGLTPAEVHSMSGEWCAMMSVLNSIGSYGRLRELAEADKDGRLVVLPCKVGDTVWFKTFKDNGKTCIGMQPHNVAGTRVCVMAEGKFFPVELPLGGLSKQWFLTREEAEKALEAKRDG